MHTPKVIIHRLDSPRRPAGRPSRRQPAGFLRTAAAAGAVLGFFAVILPDEDPAIPAGHGEARPAELATAR